MIYTPLTNEALKIAYRAHHTQVDKAGVPYVFHPYHLAEQMTDEYTTCVALLHDVVEDTDVTPEELAEVFPKEVTDAVALLTHQKGVDYMAYVAEIAKDPIAKAVKLADLKHNCDRTRLPDDCDPAELQRRAKQYHAALEFLTEER